MKQRYEITVQGHLSSQWSAVFEGMQVTCLEDGNTQISGDLADQAALYGLLMRLSDLGMALISVKQCSSRVIDSPEGQKS
jgi:hypothetical protein